MPRSSNKLFSNIGIDSIGFHAPQHFMKLGDLAKKRNTDPDKFRIGLMSSEIRIPDIGEDCVSLGLRAAKNAILRGNIDPLAIDAIFVGTETPTYAVKSIANIFQELLGLPNNIITQDVYNACAGGTLAVLNAIGLIQAKIIKKALVISVDISHYLLESPGEPTQGVGAVAMIITTNPRIASFGKNFGRVSGNINDFYRNVGEKHAEVFGKYSVDAYLDLQLNAYDNLMQQAGPVYPDYYVFHAPYPKLPLKFMQRLIEERWLTDPKRFKIHQQGLIVQTHLWGVLSTPLFNHLDEQDFLTERIIDKIQTLLNSDESLEQKKVEVLAKIYQAFLPGLVIPASFGNMYSASVWAQLMYLLELGNRAGETIYFGSYGSGATCIAGLLYVHQSNQIIIHKSPSIKEYLENKAPITVEQYENLHEGRNPPVYTWGLVQPIEAGETESFQLNYCDHGCLISSSPPLDCCPAGHTGRNSITFPLFGRLKSKIKEDITDPSYLMKGYVLIQEPVTLGTPLEFSLRRFIWESQHQEDEPSNFKNLLNWVPVYSKVETMHDVNSLEKYSVMKSSLGESFELS